MAREKKVEIGAVNITMHPHSPERYIKLFKYASKKRLVARISHNTAGLISGANYYEKKRHGSMVLTGDLYRFGDIDWNSDWFNTLTNQTAEEGDLDGVQIPRHLKPNSSRFSYLLFAEKHMLFYESYYTGHSLGHSHALKLLRGVFDDASVVERFGEIDVTTIPSKERLNQAMKIPQMDKLHMVINRPNADSLADAEQRVLRRLNAQNARRQTQELVAISGESIEPDEDTKTLARIASRNGEVTVKGKDREDHPVTYSTKKHPWDEKAYYDPDTQTAFNTFSDNAEQSYAKLTDSDNE